MPKQPRFKDACNHGLERFMSTINNKDIYDLTGTYGKTDGFCIRYGHHRHQCHDTNIHNLSQLIGNIYGKDNE